MHAFGIPIIPFISLFLSLGSLFSYILYESSSFNLERPSYVVWFRFSLEWLYSFILFKLPESDYLALKCCAKIPILNSPVWSLVFLFLFFFFFFFELRKLFSKHNFDMFCVWLLYLKNKFWRRENEKLCLAPIVENKFS